MISLRSVSRGVVACAAVVALTVTAIPASATPAGSPAAAQPFRTASAVTCASNGAPFPDVKASAVHCDSIWWLTGNNITKPAGNRYHPRAAVSRQAMAMFLFRLTHPGKAAPSCTSKPFRDVPVGSVFCGAIDWAKTHHIAEGYGASGDFGPARAVTRGAMAAFLKRAGTDDPTPQCTERPFRDVPTGSVFCGAITWIAGKGITRGVGDGTSYGVAQPVTRASMATFLRRMVAHTDVSPTLSSAPVEPLGRQVSVRVDDPRLAAVHVAPSRKAKVVERLPWGHTYQGRLVAGTLWYKIGPDRYLEAGTVNPASSYHEKLGLHVDITIVGKKPAVMHTAPKASSKTAGSIPVGAKISGQLANNSPWYKVADQRYIAASSTRIPLYGAMKKPEEGVISSQLGYVDLPPGVFGEVIGRVPYGKAVMGQYVGSERVKQRDGKVLPVADWYKLVKGGYVSVEPYTVKMGDSDGITNTGILLTDPTPKPQKLKLLPYDPSEAINAARAKKGWAPLKLVPDPELVQCVRDNLKLEHYFEDTPCRTPSWPLWSAQYAPTSCSLDYPHDASYSDPTAGFWYSLLGLGNADTKTMSAVMATQPTTHDPSGSGCFVTIRMSQ